MSKNKVSIVKVQKIMQKMQIDDEICASSEPNFSKIVENQSFNDSQHLHQHQHQHQQQKQKHQQQRSRSSFFYHLRQKRKQRRLQHGPLPIDHQQQNGREIKRNNQEQKREILYSSINYLLKNGNKLITAIVGSSIARNISVKHIESETDEVRLRFKSGSDCADALAWLKSNEGQIFMRDVNQLIFIIGTNDIHRVGADGTVRRIAETVQSVRYLYSGVNIVWQLLQRRTRKTWLLPEGQFVLNEIHRCNTILVQVAAEMNFNTIQPDIPIECMYDGLHPSTYGVSIMEATIRNYLKRNKIIYSSSFSQIPSLFQIATPPPSLMSLNF